MNYFDLSIAVLAAVVLFLHGLQGFSRELQAHSDGRLQGWLERLTRTRMGGFLLGALFTALVQSSSAVTALAVALVDAGTIPFANSLAVLIGANVGTTSTAWLVSLHLTGIGASFVVLGTLIGLFPGSAKVAGKSVFYFGLIFYALDLVGASLEPIKSDPVLIQWLSAAQTPIIGAAIGALLTALVQSSSVITGLVILLVQTGALDVTAAIAIIMGANVGTTVTGLIAAIPMELSAKRTALANLIFNLGGVSLFLPLASQLSGLVTAWTEDPAMAVAMAHLIFNVGVAVLALPLVGPVARWLMPEHAVPHAPAAAKERP